MSRGFGELDLIQSAIPEWSAPVVAALTQLGDGWFLVTLLVVLYLTQRDSRDDILLVGGLLACGVGLYRGLKHLFELPRPDAPLADPATFPGVVESLYEATAHATSYGFPSGHATSAMVVYFGLALVLPVWTRAQRLLVAGVLVTVVSLTRVALGVHFLVDVVAGVLLSALLLGVTFGVVTRVTRARETVVFTAAVGLNAFYVVTSEGHLEAVLMVVGSVGLLVGWLVLTRHRES